MARGVVQSAGKKYRVNERRFLNLPGFHGGANIQATIEDTRGDRGHKYNRYVGAPDHWLTISDCSKEIRLEFDWGGAENNANSLHKIDTLIDVLVRFRKGLVVEQALYQKRHGDADDEDFDY